MQQAGTVVSAQDPRVADYVALTDVALRRRREPAEGLFIAEGEKVIRRAVAAGYPLRSVFCERRWLEPLADVLTATDAPVYVAAAPVLGEVTGFSVHRGALAAMARLPLPSPADLLHRARRLVVLEDLVDHTNVGAVFRAAAGLGMDAALLSPRCSDPLYRRAVKVSMGAVFALPYARLEPWPAALHDVRAAGVRLLALTPDPAADALEDLSLADLDRCALLFGAEGSGLSPPVLDLVQDWVRIPMARGVDSLNVAAAAAVACWALSRGCARKQS